MNKFLSNTYEDYGCGIFLLACILVIALAFGLFCLNAWLVMLLWNAVVCSIWVALPSITFWQSFGLILIVRLIFGGFKLGGSSNSDD